MYQSPLRLAGITDPDPDAKALQLARKKLLAELELSGQPALHIDGAALSRQDIITLFDSLSDAATFRYHAALLEDPDLLLFLEKGELGAAAWQERPVYGEPDFIAFASPYFAAAVNALLQDILSGTVPEEAFAVLFHRPQFLQVQHAEAAFAAASRFYFRRKAAVQAFTAQLGETGGGRYENIFDPVTMADRLTFIANDPVSPEEIIEWKEASHLMLLNMLPDEFFSSLRYDIANELNEICVIADTQRHSTATGYAALQAAAGIDCEASLKEVINKNLEIFREKLTPRRAPGQEKKEKPKFAWSWIGIVLFLISRLIIGANSCNTTSVAPRISTDNLQAMQEWATKEVTLGKSNYDSLYSAFTSGESSSAHDTLTAGILMLNAPKKPGDDPFAPLWQQLNHTDEEAQYNTKVLQIENTSNWDALALYLSDDKLIRSAFIPAHQSAAINYNGHKTFRLNMLAGKGWSPKVPHWFNSVATSEPGHNYLLQGGFKKTPIIISEPLARPYLLQEDDPGSTISQAYRITIADSASAVTYLISSYGS